MTVAAVSVVALASALSAQAKVPPAAHLKVPDACKVLTPDLAEGWIVGVVGRIDPIHVPPECDYSDEKPAPESVASIGFDIRFHRGTEQKAHELWKKFSDELKGGEGTLESIHGFGADDSVGFEHKFETASPPKVSTLVWWRKGKWVGTFDATSTVQAHEATLEFMPHALKVLMRNFYKAFR
jgi:hypothetical protein